MDLLHNKLYTTNLQQIELVEFVHNGRADKLIEPPSVGGPRFHHPHTRISRSRLWAAAAAAA